VGIAPWSAAIGDFNGDRRQDLAVVDDIAFGRVSILLGRDDGTVELETRVSVGMYPDFVTVGDFNGDGRQDLAVENRYTCDVSILLGRGDGSFGPETRVGVGMYPTSIAVGDFNGDGRQDLVVATEGYPQGVSILLGRGDGTFALQIFHKAGWTRVPLLSEISMMTGIRTWR